MLFFPDTAIPLLKPTVLYNFFLFIHPWCLLREVESGKKDVGILDRERPGVLERGRRSPAICSQAGKDGRLVFIYTARAEGGDLPSSCAVRVESMGGGGGAVSAGTGRGRKGRGGELLIVARLRPGGWIVRTGFMLKYLKMKEGRGGGPLG